MNMQEICSCHHDATMLVCAVLQLAHRAWELRWEAAIDLFHNSLCTTQSIEISENTDFCPCLHHKQKQPQALHCFPR